MRYAWLFILPLLALVAIVAYSIFHFHTKQRKTKKAAMVAHSKRVKALPEYEKVRKKYRFLLVVVAICFAVSVVSITISASRPISVDVIEPDYETRDIVLCIDVSGSQSNAMIDVLTYFSSTLSKLRGQRVGIGIFAAKAAIVSPLTNDYDALELVLKDILNTYSSKSFDSFGIGSTALSIGASSAIGDGIINCASAFDKITEEGRAQSIIVATDDYQNDGIATVKQAGNYLAKYGIILYGIDTVKESSAYAMKYNERIDDLRQAVKTTGGLYYNLPAQGINGSQAASDIMKQEAAKHDSVAQFAQMDSPKISTIVALCSIIAMLSIVWRLKL